MDKWLKLFFFPEGRINRKVFIQAYLVVQLIMLICFLLYAGTGETKGLFESNLKTVEEYNDLASFDTRHKTEVQNHQAVRENHIASSADSSGFGHAFNSLLYSLSLLGLGYSTIVLTIKRLRDVNQNPWWCVLNFVPYVNFLLSIYLSMAKTKNENDRPAGV